MWEIELWLEKNFFAIHSRIVNKNESDRHEQNVTKKVERSFSFLKMFVDKTMTKQISQFWQAGSFKGNRLKVDFLTFLSFNSFFPFYWTKILSSGKQFWFTEKNFIYNVSVTPLNIVGTVGNVYFIG